MKITKDENGKLIINGEGKVFFFPDEGDVLFDVKEIGEIKEIQEMYIDGDFKKPMNLRLENMAREVLRSSLDNNDDLATSEQSKP